MAVRARCPNPECCREDLAPDSVLGKSVRCKMCGTKFLVTAQETVDGGSAETSETGQKKPGSAAQANPPATRGPRANSAELPIGATIGRFEVRQRLGAGAFGTVYKAFDPQLQREIAIKVPNALVLNNPQMVLRFLREARAAAKLRHPNIVPVFDAGEAGPCLYMATAYVQGEPLSEGIGENGMDQKRAATIAQALAEALGYAHQEGIVHRDVKPANVMLDQIDQPLLMDFGLAAEVDSQEIFPAQDKEVDSPTGSESSRLTRAGTVMGTPSYMAPEMAEGQQGEAKPASDQYSLGVVLYELLTGKVPFEGPPYIVLHNVIQTPPPAPHTFRPDVSPDLEAVCLKAMAKDPRQRYVNCYALANDLRRWLEGAPVHARRLGYTERFRRWLQNEPKLALMSGGMAAALLVIAGLTSILFASSYAAQRDEARRETEETRDLLEAEKSGHEKARDALNDEAMALSRAFLANGKPREAIPVMLRVPEDRRDFAWNLQKAWAEGIPEFRRQLDASEVLALDFLEDNRRLLQLTPYGNFVFWDIYTGEKVKTIPLGQAVGTNPFLMAASIGDQGRLVATMKNVPVPKIPVEASPAAPVPLAPAPGAPNPAPVQPVAGPKPAPGSQPKGVAPIRMANRIEVNLWDEKGKLLRALDLGELKNNQVGLALSQNGKWLAIAGGFKGPGLDLSVWNTETGERLTALDKTLSSVPGPLTRIALAFSPDGKWIATTTILEDNGEIRVWEMETGGEKLVIKDRAAVISHLVFSPDGKQLAAAGGGDRLEGPSFKKKNVKQVPETVMLEEIINGKTVSKMITKLKSVEEEMMVAGYRNPKTKPGRVGLLDNPLPGFNQAGMRPMQWAGAKPRDLVQDIESLVRTWDVETGKQVAAFMEEGRVKAVVWLADGKTLATACEKKDTCNGINGCDSPGLLGEDQSTLALWRADTGKKLISLQAPVDDASTLAFSGDLKHAALGGMEYNGLTTWSTESNWLLANPLAGSPVNSLVFSPDSDRLISDSACDDGARLWKVPSGEEIARLGETGGFLRFLAQDGIIARLPDAGNGLGGPYADKEASRPLQRRLAQDGKPANHPGNSEGVLVYSADGNRFIAASKAGGGLEVNDGVTGKTIATLENSSGQMLEKLQISSNGTRVSSLRFGLATLWDANNGKVISRRPNVSQAELSPDGRRWVIIVKPPPQGGAIRPVAPMAANAAPAVPPKTDPPAILVLSGDGKELGKLPGCDPVGYRQWRIDPKSDRLLGVTQGNLLQVWGLTGQKINQLIAQYRIENGEVAISPDGRLLAFFHGQAGNQANDGNNCEIPAVADTKAIMNASKQKVENSTPVQKPEEKIGASPPSFTDCKGRKGTWIGLLDLDSGSLISQKNFDCHDHGPMAFSPDGKRLAVAFTDGPAGVIQVWDTEKKIAAEPSNAPGVSEDTFWFTGHFGAVKAIAFSPDGKLLASGGEDQRVKVWRIPEETAKGPGVRKAQPYPAAMPAPLPPSVSPAPVPAPPLPSNIPRQQLGFQRPGFDEWARQVAGLPATKQVDAVAKKLVELNPGFDGKLTPVIDKDMVTELSFSTAKVTDLSPLRALGKLKSLQIDGKFESRGAVVDLSPLTTLSLTNLSFNDCNVSDLKPLKGMPLTKLSFRSTQVSDLRPLMEMKLTTIHLDSTPVTDLSPLKGMPLTSLSFGVTKVSDLSPLKGMPIETLMCGPSMVSDLSPLKGMPLTWLMCPGTKVSDLSPLKGMPIKALDCGSSMVSDLSPLKGMPLTWMRCPGTQVSDLSPLSGMRLLTFLCAGTPVVDLSPLKAMPLENIECNQTKVSDHSPLKDLPLKSLNMDFKPDRDTELLKSIKTLERINDKPAADFWKTVEGK